MEFSDLARREERDALDREADSQFQIEHGIQRALHSRQDVDRGIAQLIAGELSSDPESALGAYAITGHGTNEELRREYLAIYEDRETSERTRELVEWLGSHLVNHENQVPSSYARPEGRPRLRTTLWQLNLGSEDHPLRACVPADTPDALIQRLPDYLLNLADCLGDAFIAFLSLPDVDATAEDLERIFDECYEGTFHRRSDALNDFFDTHQVQKCMDELKEAYLAGAFLSLDHDAMWEVIQEGHDVVEFPGGFHVFFK